ncbi:unnamed protein product [Closterium sp. NIES-53]
MTKYHVDDTVARQKARLVVKGLTQVYGADYDETYVSVCSYVTLTVFLSIVAALDLHLMQLDLKNALLKSKLDRVLYMDQPSYNNNDTNCVCKLPKSLYSLKQSPLLRCSTLDAVLNGASWSKSLINEAPYFKVGDDGVSCWVLDYINDLLAARSSLAMMKELSELLHNAFEQHKISPVEKYLGLEIVRGRPAWKLWLHQQSYVNKLLRHFIDEELSGQRLKTPVFVNAYADMMFGEEDFNARDEDEYRQKFGSLQVAATTTRPDIAFACNELGSDLTTQGNQH